MSKRIRIIGLSGTNGAGKDAVGLLLAEKYNYWFISVTDILRDELQQRGLPIDREHLRGLSAEWRRAHGLGVLIDRAVQAFEARGGAYAGVVMASLRNPHEADRVHELDGTVVWVDADPAVRYARIQANAAGRGRAGEDNKTFEQFLAEEAAEMHAPAGADQAALSMAEVKEKADVFIKNNSNDLGDLQGIVVAALGL